MSHKKRRPTNNATPDQAKPHNGAAAPEPKPTASPASASESAPVNTPPSEPERAPESLPAPEPQAAPKTAATSEAGPEDSSPGAAAQDAERTPPSGATAGPDFGGGAAERSAPAAPGNAPAGNGPVPAEQSVKAPETTAPADPAQSGTKMEKAGAEKKGFDPERFASNFSPPPKPRNLRRKLLFTLLALMLLLLVAAGYAAFTADRFLNTPAGETEATLEVEILRGDTFGKVANRLEKAGIITNALFFRLYAMWEKRTASIQAGVFEFSTAWTPREVLRHLVFGQPVLYRLTVREGLPWWEVAKLVEENGFAKAEDFKEVIHDAEFLAKHSIPFASAEGFLFPDTYLLRRPKEMNKEAALALADRLVGTFEKKTRELFAEANVAADTDKLKQIIILASMVEKETSIAAERPLVAGVFANRLRLGMLMQCDPTIIYGLGESFNGNLRKRDLDDDNNPYNTYRHAGLPPGPICSPGLSAIAAAVRPAEHDYLYFVATKAGGEHVFNATLSGHNKAVNKYQRGRGN